MITCITRRDGRGAASGNSAFTLVEVIIGATLGTLVLAGVLSAFLMLGRSGTSIVGYMTTDTQTRRGIEELSQDLRMARNFTWNSSTSITLTVPDNYLSTSNRVTYAWDNATGSPTLRCFYRMPGDAGATNTRTVLIRNITSFSYSRYDRLNAAATTNVATKRVQMSITMTTSAQTAAARSDTVVTASFVLRNKTAS